MILPALQNTVIRLSLRSRTWRALFRIPYRILLTKLRFIQRMVPVRALYLRQGLLEPDWVPGASDVDVIWILRSDIDEKNVVCRLWRMMGLLKKFFPILGEVLMADEEELRFFDLWGDGRTQNRAGWKSVGGEDIPPGPEGGTVPDWKHPWDHWTRAVMAYHLLIKNYLNPAESVVPTRALSVQKHFLDVCRHLRAMEGPYESRADTRDSILRKESPLAPPDTRGILNDPLTPSLPEIARLCAAAHSLLREKGRDVHRRLAAGNADPARIRRWGSTLARNEWEVQAWRKRFLQLQDRLQGSATALFCNTLTHSTLVLKDGISDDSFENLLAEIRRFKKEDRGLQGPMEVLDGTMFRMSLCCAVHGHPFSYFTHDRSPHAEDFQADSIVDGNILVQCRSERMDIPVPPLDTIGHLARTSLAEFLPSWRTLDHPFSDSDAFYSLYRWMTTALSLTLFMEKGLLGNPDDLEGLIDQTVNMVPDSEGCLKRGFPRKRLSGRELTRLFYCHYGDLKALLRTARASS